MLNICTINLQNKYKLQNYNGINIDGTDNVQVLCEFLKSNNINIAGTQELVPKYEARLSEALLREDYQIIGEGRFADRYICENIIYGEKFNESNSIITNAKVLSSNNIRLPWLPSTFPRIVTTANIVTEDDNIYFMNTHLDFLFKSVKIRQLKKIRENILEIKSNKKNSIFLTGDFNMNMDMPEFYEFVKELRKYGIIHVPVAERTLKNSSKDYAIDHIFISDDYNLQDFEVVKTLNEFSDHYPILAKVNKK